MAKPSELLAAGPAASEPMVVYTGPKKTGTALIAAVAVDDREADAAASREKEVAGRCQEARRRGRAEGRSQG